MAPHKHDDSVFTRACSLCGLVVSWFVGVGALLAGAICLYLERRDASGNSTHITMSHTWTEVLPLGLNVFVTLLNDSMGYIHSCSLRWSLQREGNLDFNSNLRLLTAAKHHPPNGAIPNAIYLAGIVLSYGSTSLIFLSLNPELAKLLGKDHDTLDTDGIHLNSIALLTFGGGFLLQAAITNWTLARTNIPTWSSNPLDVARAATVDEHDGHRVEPRIGRCMMSVHLAKEDARACQPSRRQGPMITAHHHVRRILILLWSLPILAAIWGAGVYGYLLNHPRSGVFGRSWSFLPLFTGRTDSNCSTKQCTDGTSVLSVGWSGVGAAGMVGAVFLITGFQSVVTLSLHCAELIVNLARDEKVYRALIGPRGTNGHYNSILAAFTSWQTISLFALKACVHWMFGLAINLQYHLGVNMYPPQIFYFAAFSLASALFGLSLSLWRPSGYLPASYGHIQTIADVVDDWADSGCMFWGEKKGGNPGYTGTSPRRLEPPVEGKWYGGANQYGPSRSTLTSIPVELHSLSPSSPSPGLSPPPYATPHVQPRHAFSQWAREPQQAQYRQSHQSLNSAYSGYSSYSNQSARPFLSGHWA